MTKEDATQEGKDIMIGEDMDRMIYNLRNVVEAEELITALFDQVGITQIKALYKLMKDGDL